MSQSSRPDIHVLSTRSFTDAWLDQLRAISPRLMLDQVTADTAEEVPASVWAKVEVLYTWGALPDPAQAPNLRWVQLDTAGVNHLLEAMPPRLRERILSEFIGLLYSPTRA